MGGDAATTVFTDTDDLGFAVGALMHDVGKAVQRALRNDPRRALVEREYGRVALPGRVGLVHEKWSAWFLSRHFPDVKLAERIALYHHRPETDDPRERIVQLADHLAAGERHDPEDDETGPPDSTPIRDVLCRVAHVREAAPAKPAVDELPLTPITDPETWFPRPVSADEVRRGYASVLAYLEAHMPGPELPCERRFERLLHTLRVALAQVPAAVYRTLPDISLYDHSRFTAAFAWCLYQMLKRGSLPDIVLRLEPQDLFYADRAQRVPPLFLLVGGDISGIQAFLYRVGSERALRSLKGRSAYLQLLTEAAVSYLLERLGLTRANVVYAAGGHFFLLAPYDAKPALAGASRAVTETLLRHHSADLVLAVASVPVQVDDIRLRRFGVVWSRLLQELWAAKHRLFAGLGSSAYDAVIGPFGPDGPTSHCATSGLGAKADPQADGPWCTSFAELGTTLAHLGEEGYVTFAPPGPNRAERGWQAVLAELGVEVAFRRDRPPSHVRTLAVGRLAENVDGVLALARHAPLQRGEIASFEAIADAAEGWPRWGVLRADVDNLGRVFAHGLGERQSPSRIATFSSRLELFFGVYVDRLVAEVYPLAYTIYSGGDDLFVVGPWSALPGLARRIREEFARFAGRTPQLSLSAAVALPLRVKTPIRSVAEVAGAMLEEAKARTSSTGELVKDAVNLFGQTFGWTEGYDPAAQLQEDIVELLRRDVPRALLQILYLGAEVFAEDPDEPSARKAWVLRYHLERLRRRVGCDDLQWALWRLEERLFARDAAARRTLGVATFWAELRTRLRTADPDR